MMVAMAGLSARQRGSGGRNDDGFGRTRLVGGTKVRYLLIFI
jgi:hypothetical protein